jgi:hypothetical protein
MRSIRIKISLLFINFSISAFGDANIQPYAETEKFIP